MVKSVDTGSGLISVPVVTGWLIGLFFVSYGGLCLSQTENSRLSLPHSHLGSPFQSPIFVTGHVALAAGGVVDGLQTGAGATFLFHPGEADHFLDFLHGWNSSLVLQAEYHHVNADQRILSGDMIIRRYLDEFSVPTPRKATFVGLGIGASEVTLVPPDGSGFETGWEFIAEAGQEWNLRPNFLAYWQLQYRSYEYHGHDFSHWSLKLGAGIPWPW